MTREQVIEEIRSLLNAWIDDSECPLPDRAEEVYEQLPITSCESSGEWSFTDLARLAAHDVERASIHAR